MNKNEDQKSKKEVSKPKLKLPMLRAKLTPEEDKNLPSGDIQLYQAFDLIQKNNLLYYRSMKKLNILSTPDFTLSCGGIGYNPTNRKVYMLLNENDVRRNSVPDVAGLCEHEQGHLLYEHIFMDFFINNQATDHDKMNQGQDYIINDNCHFIRTRLNEIVNNEKSMLKNGCFLENLYKVVPKLKEKHDELHSLDVYKALVELEQQQKQQQKQNQQSQKGQKSDQQGQGQSGDQDSDSDDNQDSDSSQNGKKDQKKKNKGNKKQDQNAQGSDDQQDQDSNGDQGQDQQQNGQGQGDDQNGEIDQHGNTLKTKKPHSGGFDLHDIMHIQEDENGDAQIVGTLADLSPEEQAQAKAEMGREVKGSFLQAIEELKREGKLDQAVGQLGASFKHIVKKLIRAKTDKTVIFDFVTSLQIGKKSTWTKLNKRFPMVNRGKVKLKRPCLVVGIDDSGSMWSDEFQSMIVYQVQELSQVCETLYVVAGDCQKTFELKIENRFSFKPEMIEFIGGGGTDMNFVAEFAESVGADGILLHTDGDFYKKYDNRNIPTKVFLYGNHCKEVPDFENFRVYPE